MQQHRTSTNRRADMNGRTRYALLRLVRDGVFVSRVQVLSLCGEYGIESGTSSTGETLKSLVRSKLLFQEPADRLLARIVYSITQKGLAVLEHNGDELASVTSQSEVIADPIQMAHFLFLNDLHIAMCPHITNWVSEPHVRSLRITNQIPFAKDYDAVVEMGDSGNTVRFAIEYEQTRKSQDRYAAIAQNIQTEKHLDAVLYLSSSPALLALLNSTMHASPNVCTANAKVFHSQLLETEVTSGVPAAPVRCRLSTFLMSRLAARGKR
jgi:hypothetical protein